MTPTQRTTPAGRCHRPAHAIRQLCRVLLAGALGLLAGCFPATQPQRPVASLHGLLRSDTGSPIGGVEVNIAGQSKVTDGAGEFIFTDLPTGRVRLGVAAGGRTSIEIESLQPEQQNEIVVTLDRNGNIVTAEIRRVGGASSRGEAIHRLVRRNYGPGDARGKVEIEEEGNGDEEFEIELDRMPPGQVFDVYLQRSLLNPSLEMIGSIVVDSDGEGELEFETEEGQSLPFGMELEDLFGLRVEIRPQGSPDWILEGTVPPGLPPMGGKSKGEKDLINVAGPPGGEGEVKIKSKPRKHDERFYVKVEDMTPYATYAVCVECGIPKAGTVSGPTYMWTETDPYTGTAMVEATLSIPHATADPNAVIDIPLRVTTSDTITYVSFTVEYSSTHLQLLDVLAGSDAVAAGFTHVEYNTNPGFAPVMLDRHVVVQVSHPAGTGSIAGGNVARELAKLSFRVANLPGSTAPIKWDRTVPPGLPRTFLEVLPGRTLTGAPTLAFEDGSITIRGGVPGAFECVGFITTDDDGEGKLKIKNKNGDRLPCGVEYVTDLQWFNGGDRRVEVRRDNATGTLTLHGRVPRFGEDDDDDDD